MRTEQIRGRWLLCNVILHKDKIKPGQVWAQADGSDHIVTIKSIEEDWVVYGGPGDVHQKLIYPFQARYCLVLDGPEIPKELIS